MSAPMQRSMRAPLVRVAAAHAIGVPLALMLAPAGLPWEALAAALAVALGCVFGLAVWWVAINALFVPLLSLSLEVNLSPLWACAALALLLLVYGRIWASRVPLFFSSASAQDALRSLLPRDRPIAFLDAGCGDARVIEHLATARPDSRFEGIEHALVPWLMARLRCWKHEGAYYVRRGDLWGHGLTQYDVVFAYLSPAVMLRFWEKASREMRPGSLLVTAFAVPGVDAGPCIEVGDRMNTRLHVCRIGGSQGRRHDERT
jgi:hypothetical protein